MSRDEFERFRTTLRNAEVAVEAADSGLSAVISEVKSVAAQLNQATVSLEKTSLFAPFDGVVTTMTIRQDNYYYPPAGVNSNREREASSAIVVIDDSQYEIQLEVTEQDAMNVQEGQTVYLASNDLALYKAESKDFSEGDFIRGNSLVCQSFPESAETFQAGEGPDKWIFRALTGWHVHAGLDRHRSEAWRVDYSLAGTLFP